MKAVCIAAVLASVASEEFVEGGTLKLAWSDCGDASTHAKVASLSPDKVTLGTKTTVTGSGKLDEAVKGGSFDMNVKVWPLINKDYKGDICKATKFDLPLGVGSIVWDGLACPLAAGTTDVKVDMQMSSSIPSSLAKATIKVTATASTGDKLICLSLNTSPANLEVADDCISDILKIATDAAPAAEAIKGLVTDCHGDDRSKCQADVNELLQSLTNAVHDVSGCTTSCGSHGPQCVAAIQTLSDKINSITGPAKDMADKCAGSDKSTISCVIDGVKVGADVAGVAGQVANVVKVCKAGDIEVAGEPNGIGCDLCKSAVQKGIDAGEKECEALCKKAGPLDGLCEKACGLIETECSGSNDCTSKVCGLVKLCSNSSTAIVV